MNELKIFENPEFGEIRVIEIDGEPWLVGKDVAAALGYSDTNKAIAMHVDEEDKLNDKTSSSLGQRGGWLIDESGLYSLVLSSKLPSAKKFKRWVTAEVLPSIRKHGAYMTSDTIEKVLTDPDTLIKLATTLKEERQKRAALEEVNRSLQETVSIQTQQIAELTPKAGYYDLVLNCKDLVATSTIAKDYGWSAVKMNRYLHDKKVQYKQGDIWLLYQKYAEQGYTSTKTHSYPGNDGEVHSKVHMYWTQKGRLFLYELLKSDRILPLIEREAA